MHRLVILQNKLSNTRSVLHKKAILKNVKDTEVLEMIKYALDPYMMFNLTSSSLNTKNGMGKLKWSKAKYVLDKLHLRKVTGNKAKLITSILCLGVREPHIEAFKNLLDKDLKCGTAAKLINSIHKDLVPEVLIQLCQSYNPLSRVLPFEDTRGSRKLDGCRVYAVYENKDWRYFSRTGKEFFTLGVLRKAMLKDVSVKDDNVIDGEICIIDKNGKEDFKAIVSEIKKKNHTIKNPYFIMFDKFSLAAFKRGYSKIIFDKRYKYLKKIKKTKYFEVLKQEKIKSGKYMEIMMQKSHKERWEGIIYRNGQAPYEGKRTKNLLKVKKFFEHEFKIIGTYEGENSLRGTLGGIIVKGIFKKKKVKSEVGSGFTQTMIPHYKGKPIDEEKLDAYCILNDKYLEDHPDNPAPYLIIYKPCKEGQRYKLWKNRKKLIGQVVTVQFFELTQNDKGKKDEFSLRFPTFKVLHGKKRTI